MVSEAAVNPWVIDNVTLTLRLLLAMLLGGLVGLEREQANHPAGLRTHILVCLGSALIMLLSIYGFSQFVSEGNVRVDPARLATAVITGIGFLGAGTIIFTGKSIAGLTTAASLWVVAAIGLAVGAGFYYAAIITTILVLVNLFVFSKLEKRYFNGKKLKMLTLETDDSSNVIQNINTCMQLNGIAVKKMTMFHKIVEHDYGDAHSIREVKMTLILPKSMEVFTLVDELERLKGISMVIVE
ncbi:MgtC/SapB family protein [Paenibacillus marinisediminis]